MLITSSLFLFFKFFYAAKVESGTIMNRKAKKFVIKKERFCEVGRKRYARTGQSERWHYNLLSFTQKGGFCLGNESIEQ